VFLAVEEEEMLLDVERELDPNTGEVVFEVAIPSSFTTVFTTVNNYQLVFEVLSTSFKAMNLRFSFLPPPPPPNPHSL
jgi:hypothetical protein